jgi:hypothetical protein
VARPWPLPPETGVQAAVGLPIIKMMGDVNKGNLLFIPLNIISDPISNFEKYPTSSPHPLGGASAPNMPGFLSMAFNTY